VEFLLAQKEVPHVFSCNHFSSFSSSSSFLVVLILFHASLCRTPKLFDGFNYKSKGEDNERKNWGALLGS
jgi:hypothetical protein